jgi:anti-sigma factor RsiW
VLSCQDLLEELGNYLDDEVAAETRRRLEAHLSHCRACRVLVDSTRSSLKIVTDSSAFELPDSVSTKILARIRGAAGKS